MANDKTATRIIKVKAQFEKTNDFNEWLKQAEQKAGSEIGEALANNIKLYQAKMASLMQQMSDAGENPSIEISRAFAREMDQMSKLSKDIAASFAKIKLGDLNSSKLESATKAVESATVKTRRAKSNQRNWNKKLSGDSLSNSEIERIYNKNFSKSGLTVNGKQYGGAGGLGSADFVADFKKNAQSFYDAAKNLKENAIDLEAVVRTRVDEINRNIETYAGELQKAAEEENKAAENLKNVQKSTSTSGSSDTDNFAIEGVGKASATTIASAETRDAFKEEADAEREAAKAKREAESATKDLNEETKKTPSLVQKAATQVFTYGTVIGLFRSVVNNAKRTVFELDEALTGMAIVTSLSRQEAYKMIGTMQELAKETGSTTTEVAATVTKFLQQGKSLTQSLQLSEAAIKGAKIAGIDAARSVDLLTNAMNGFQLSASQAMEVSDKFAALAAASATDYEELAVALSKVAAQANLAGMSMDFTLGMLAKGIEVTREAPETIGTALKTVISRMRELTDYGETLEEGTDVNRVETALENVGVKLRDTNGQFRDLESVLTELGGKWNTLNVNQQANIAVALAGTRQQSRLIAMMQDFDRTLELVDISTNSYGATMAQHAKYMGSIQAATDRLTTSFEGLITTVANNEVIVFTINALSGLVEFGEKILNIGWLSVPIMILLTSYGANILANKIKEYQYNKASQKLDKIKQLNQNKERLNQIKIRKLALDIYIDSLKQGEATEDILKNKLEIAKTDAERSGNAALAAKYEKEILELAKDDLKEQKTLAEAEAERKTLIAEERLLLSQNLAIEQSQNGLLSVFNNTLLGIPTLLSTIFGLFSAITSIQALMITLQKTSNKEEKKGITLSIKKWNQQKKELVTKGSSTFMDIVGAFKDGGIPGIIAGIALATTLVGALVGIGFAVGSAIKTSSKNNTKKVDDNISSVQKLQSEIYNLGQEVQTVQKISDEFETLSNKINKSAEDVARLQELITEFNDTVGYEMIAPGTDSATALDVMAGYEAIIQKQLDDKVAEVNATMAKVIISGSSLIKYMNAAGGTAAVKQALGQNSEIFRSGSEGTQSLILSTIKSNADSFVSSGGGINFKAVDNVFTQSDVDVLDDAISSNSFIKYAEALDSLTDSAKKFVSTSDSLFGAISNIDSKFRKTAANQIDALGLTEEQITKLSPAIQEYFEDFNSGMEGLNKAGILSELKERMTQEVPEEMKDPTKDPEWQRARKLIARATRRGDGTFDITQLNSEKNREEIEKYMQALGDYENNEELRAEMERISKLSIREFQNEFGNAKSVTELQDMITTAQSSMSKISQLASGSLGAKETDELLQSYPELIEYIKDGIVSYEEMGKMRQKVWEQTKKDLQDELDATHALNEEKAKEEDWDWNKVKSMNTEEEIRDYLESIGYAGDADLIIGDWRLYYQNEMKLNQYIKQGMLNEQELEKVAASTGISMAKAQYESYKKEMELYSSDSSMYKTLADKASSAALQAVSKAQTDLNDARAKLDKQLSGLKYQIIDGQIFYDNNGELTPLSAIEDTSIRDAFGSAGIDELVEKYAKAEEEIITNAQNAADLYIEIKKSELEKEQEVIEQRKEAYENYFEKLDAIEEEQDRSKKKEDIITQLAALSGGIDGTTKSKIKDLQSQLEDIEKEEQEAQKEAARNSLLEDLDNQTKELNNSMEALDDTSKALIRAIKESGGKTWTVADIESYIGDFVPHNAEGGLVDYTGLAWVDGSPSAPESFLDAEDTNLLANILSGIKSLLTHSSEDVNSSSSILIESISIHTDHLNNSQDFREAGNQLARAFAEVIKERGLNVNAKQ